MSRHHPPPPPSSGYSNQMFYGNGGGMGVPPSMPHGAGYDQPMYPPNGSYDPWGESNGYPGPSREYHHPAYGAPRSGGDPGLPLRGVSSGGPPPPGQGWTSVHPSAAGPQRVSPAGSHVKLEDLVSHDRAARTKTADRQNHNPAGLTSMPLNTTPGEQRATSSGGNQDAGPSNAPAGPSEFIKKLYKMLEEESMMYGRGKPPGAPRAEGAPRGSVGWGRGGTTFVVWDMNDFTTKVLHSNFSSFVRQLNKYGFSKIKHVDEETGQIRENVWEFQHPNFQAGGKADLDSIKRKAVVPKKGANEADNETSPAARAGGGGGGEDGMRLVEMESRVVRLEDQLASALDEVRMARQREMGLGVLLRDMIGQLARVEKASTASPASEIELSPGIIHLYSILDQLTQSQNPLYGMPPPNYAHMRMGAFGSGTQVSPDTDGSGSRGSAGGPSPPSKGGKGSSAYHSSRHVSGVTTGGPEDDGVELPKHQQTLYNGEPLGVTPNFAETPAWLTEGTTAPMQAYHRKSSDAHALQLMVDALSNPGRFANSNGVPGGGGETQDPLDPSVRAKTGATSIQASPFGTLIIPPNSTSPPETSSGVRGRRSTTITPHWNKAPRILVVEDDLVYRQLSSKFLEKFGCITETVENAQGAIEKMNKTKYDLVLMDIFFGPLMDGRKATSLIRQFDMYTPIISMTSSAQPQDVTSYLQSGMNDVLAKPFTKNGLFGILDKHLIHLKAIQLSAEIPRSVGVPPLSDQGVVDAVATGAANWVNAADDSGRNPLAGMGWSDDAYQIVLTQFLATGMMPDVSAITLNNGTIGTNVVFGNSADFSRKRSIETVEDEWSPSDPSTVPPVPPAAARAHGKSGGRETKKAKK